MTMKRRLALGRACHTSRRTTWETALHTWQHDDEEKTCTWEGLSHINEDHLGDSSTHLATWQWRENLHLGGLVTHQGGPLGRQLYIPGNMTMKRRLALGRACHTSRRTTWETALHTWQHDNEEKTCTWEGLSHIKEDHLGDSSIHLVTRQWRKDLHLGGLVTHQGGPLGRQLYIPGNMTMKRRLALGRACHTSRRTTWETALHTWQHDDEEKTCTWEGLSHIKEDHLGDSSTYLVTWRWREDLHLGGLVTHQGGPLGRQLYIPGNMTMKRRLALGRACHTSRRTTWETALHTWQHDNEEKTCT